MKLRLETQRDVNILVVDGDVQQTEFRVLQAGIKKLFLAGKNKIILEFLAAKHFSPEILRELSGLNLLASELAGQIVLVVFNADVKIKLESFSQPSAIRCVLSRELAMEVFHPKPETDTKAAAPVAPAKPKPAAPAAAAAHTPTSKPKAAAPAAPAEAPKAPEPPEDILEKKTKIHQSELNDLSALRRRIQELEVENRELITLLKDITQVRRDPPDLDGWRSRTLDLENQLNAAYDQLNQLSAKK